MSLKFTAATLLFACLFLSASKVKIKKNTVYRPDGSVYFKVLDDKIINAKEILNQNDSLFILIKNNEYYDPMLVTPNNANGRVTYLEARIPGKDTVLFEFNTLNLIRKLYDYFDKYHIILKDGRIDNQRLKALSADVGKDHSRRRNELMRR
jgi:hypothetical protein